MIPKVMLPLLTREGELNLSVIPMIEKEGKNYFLDETTRVPKADDKYNRETLSQNRLAVPCSTKWKSLLPECKEGIYYFAMKKQNPAENIHTSKGV